jgi:micrococcal nuclease
MKRLLLVVALGLLNIVPQHVADLSHSFTPTLIAQEDPARITVYITRTGEKYHRDGCRYLSRSKIATTLRDAVANGYGPCSVCKPPRLRR